MVMANKKKTVMQTFNDGILSICSAKDHEDGTTTLTVKHALLRYHERTVGINRYYRAKQESVEISMLVRIPWHGDVSTQDVAVLGDGRQFGIMQVQKPEGVMPPCLDISLERVVHDYDVDGV